MLVAKSARIVPGAASFGLVAPKISRCAKTAFSPSNTETTTGPEITGVTMHSVPNWVGDDHRITAEIEGVKAVVDICSSTSAIAGWSAVSLLRNLSSPVCFY